MMTRTLKRKIIGFLFAVTCVCFAAMFVGVKSTKTFADDVKQMPQGALETVENKVTLDDFKLLGGEIRIAEPYGLRFVTAISDADLAKLPKNAEFGTLIIPADVLGEGELNLSTPQAANAVAKVGYSAASGYKGYTGTLVGKTLAESFLERDYARGFVAVGYVTYTYGDNQKDTVYTEKTTKYFAGIANTALGETAYADNETLKGFVNTALKDLTVTADKTELVTGETAALTVGGVEQSVLNNLGVEIAVAASGAAGYDGTALYGKTVGKATVTATIKSTGKELFNEEITVNPIVLADYFDNVEFRRNSDDKIDFSAITENADVIGKAFLTNNLTSFKLNNEEQTTKPTINGKALTFAANSERGKFTAQAIFSDAEKEIEYTFEFKTRIVDYLISTKEDFDKINEISALSGVAEVNDGYFMLANDIEYNGVRPYDKAVGEGTDNGGDGTIGFKGTLDGDGHFINGLTIVGRDGDYWHAAIFRTLATGSVIKNIAFVNAYLYNGAAYCGYLAGTASDGALIQDVMISGKIKTTGSQVYFNPSFTIGYSTKAYTCRRVVVVQEAWMEETNYGGINPIAVSAAATYEDCYALACKYNATAEGLTQGQITNGKLHFKLAFKSDTIGAGAINGELIRTEIDAKFKADFGWDTNQTVKDNYGTERQYLAFKNCMKYCDWSLHDGPKGELSGKYNLPAAE